MGLHASTAGGTGSVPHRGAKPLQAVQHGQEEKKKKKKKKYPFGVVWGMGWETREDEPSWGR